MTMWHFMNRGRGRIVSSAALCLLLGLSGCGLDKVDIPALDGPSTYGLSLLVHISPDVLTADAVSTASVQAQLRGPDGQPVAGRAVFFQIVDSSGTPVAIGQLGPTSDRVPNNRGPEVTEVTGADGVAEVIYRVPERIAFNDVSFIQILARLVGNDAQGQQTKSVTLEIRPAEARTFPSNPTNAAPTCGFFVDPPQGPVGGAYHLGQVLRLISTASDSDGSIIRYYWDFGDGTSEDGKTEVDKAYFRSGNYTITHVCTDNNGAQGAFTLDVTIVP